MSTASSIFNRFAALLGTVNSALPAGAKPAPGRLAAPGLVGRRQRAGATAAARVKPCQMKWLPNGEVTQTPSNLM